MLPIISPPFELFIYVFVIEMYLAKFNTAVYAGDFVSAEQLLDAGHNINARDICGNTILYYVVEGHGPFTITRWLCEHGAEPTSNDLFFAAIANNDINTASYLIEKGADPYEKINNCANKSVYEWCQNNDSPCGKYIIHACKNTAPGSG